MTSKAVRNRVGGPTQSGTTVVATRCTRGEGRLDKDRRLVSRGTLGSDTTNFSVSSSEILILHLPRE